MLALIGALTIVIMLALIMTKKMQTLLALIVVPIIGCLVAGFTGLISVEEGTFSLSTMGGFITSGLQNIAPTGVMFIFAILFFGILTDAGTFDPIISGILKVVGKNPVKICIGTVILACLVHLDGSGAVTFLIAIPAMLPLYEKLGMRKTTLATLVALGAGVMNMLPWGGPTIRAITALDTTVNDLYKPMVPAQIAGIVFIILIAIFLGKKEQKRLGDSLNQIELDASTQANIEENDLKRPKLFIFNIALIIIAVVILITAILPPAVVFMIATALALIVNYPDIKSSALVNLIPATLGKALPTIIGVISMPLSLLFDPDSYYYGVMPVVANAAGALGVDPLMIGRASIIGQMTTGFPISPLTGATFLLTGLAGIDLGEHQKHTFVFAFLTTIVMLIVSIIVGSISI